MILPSTYSAALLLTILSMICWGSWANTFKLTGKWRFELFYFDYAVGVLLAAVVAAFTFGSMGGEEFFSYLNISDSLHRAGGEQWNKWNNQIKTQLVRLQNEDGTWAGHHCITGRVAVTSAAVMTLLAERDPVVK